MHNELEGIAAACPECAQLVESWELKPGYVLTADYVPGTLVPIPGTERKVRAEGAQGPEWTLRPCGHQFYRLRFVARNNVITEIIDAFAEVPDV
jgi:hypothetical protein